MIFGFFRGRVEVEEFFAERAGLEEGGREQQSRGEDERGKIGHRSSLEAGGFHYLGGEGRVGIVTGPGINFMGNNNRARASLDPNPLHLPES